MAKKKLKKRKKISGHSVSRTESKTTIYENGNVVDEHNNKGGSVAIEVIQSDGKPVIISRTSEEEETGENPPPPVKPPNG